MFFTFVITVTFTGANINLSEQKQTIIPTWHWQTHSPYYQCCHLPSFFLIFFLFIVFFCLLAIQTQEVLLTVRIHILHLTLRANRPSPPPLSVSPPPLFLCAFPLTKCILGLLNAERYCSSKYGWSSWKKSQKGKWRTRESTCPLSVLYTLITL